MLASDAEDAAEECPERLGDGEGVDLDWVDGGRIVSSRSNEGRLLVEDAAAKACMI